ncbi:MAG: hypothetical protein MUE81_15965 [Thermoflexibacter sp.]|jgi:uncharacterized membrane protein HdeD (DUF308 family)|nr:hypothetical protein [Thermoflexibacter sp.]
MENTTNETPMSNEQKANIGKKIVWESDLKTAEGNIKKAKYTLLGIGILYLVFTILAFLSSNIMGGIFAVIVGGLLIFLSFRVDKAPKISIAIGLAIIVFFYILDLILDPSSITRGLIIKVMVVLALTYGLVGAINAEKIKKKYAELE